MKHYSIKLILIGCFILIVSITNSIAQTGTLKGHVTTSDGQAAANVNISLKENKKSTASTENGAFEIKKVNVGKHTVVVSFVGLKPQEKVVVITANQTTELDFKLLESADKLSEVIISGHKTLNERPVSGTKSGISNMDLPQTIASIGHTVIADQQATRLGDVLKNVSGVSLTQTRLGVNETYSARGYSIGITGGAGNILKNGLMSNIAGMPEAATLESVEVLKGSSAMLYGNVSGGLIVNMVTKKPKFNYGGEVSMLVGSNQQYKPIVDLYGPITKNLAFRVVGTYENDKSYRDVVKTERTYINPSFLYKFGKKTTLLVQGDYLNAKLTPDFGIGTLDSGRVLPTTIARNKFLNVLWAYNNVRSVTGSFNLEHKLSDNWQLSVLGSIQKTDVDSYGAGLPNVVSKTGVWNRALARAKSTEKDYTGQFNFNGKVNTGRIGHQILIGADYTRITIATDSFPTIRYDTINILDTPLYTRRNDVPDVALIKITTAPSNRAGVYVQDLISLTSKLKVLAGLRWSYQETVRTRIFTTATQATTDGATANANDKAFSPKVAIVYQPVKNTSLFASYSNNFTTNTGTDVYGSLLQPSIINQYELGVKNNFLNGKLAANLSIYRIINSNLAQQAQFTADGVTLNSNTAIKELRGQTTSDGFEVDLNGALSKNFYFMAGYGYNYMRFTKTTGAKGSNIEGERVVINPAHTANATIFYTFTNADLRGLKVGASAFYTGDRLGGYNNTVGQTQLGSRLVPLSGFTTVDLSAGYSYRQVSLLCKLSNIFNTLNYLVHDNYSIAPIAPRQLIATLAYKF